MGLVFCYLRSRSAHLRSIGRLSVVPSIFNINEPVIFGTPIVMNPVFFIPFCWRRWLMPCWHGQR